MPRNERITEDYVRQKFEASKEETKKELEKQGCYLTIEEQQSANPRIQKLLKTASKSGSGEGKPDFIVSFGNLGPLLGGEVLLDRECKSDAKRHKSKNLNQPANYAVDGALIYSSYLSKEFTVIAVGVSGQDEVEMKVDNFLQPKGHTEPENLDISELYDFNSYLEILRQRETATQTENSMNLSEYSQELNKRLRDGLELEEKERPLIVAGVLLALEDSGFCSSYPHKKTQAELASLIVTTIKERLERDNIDAFKSGTIIQTYSFLQTNTKIHTAAAGAYLKDLVKDIEDNIQPFLLSNRQCDVIGKFYNDFLRYANGGSSLGIVLTPQHITELFVELAEVNKDSVVLDICCGTGGFLISAMRKMELLAKGDKKKIAGIHESQLVGVETNAKMFCLACSNMMLRGDGKSNIFQRDCFEIQPNEMEHFKPTVALLNPPYSKTNHKELEFVLQALELLEPNGRCVAILPRSSAMTSKQGDVNLLREKILEQHTLKAVMSMPSELFADSEKSVETCAMVFEAHKPHTENTSTWFGDWKDDGFKKMRPHGRIDFNGDYDKAIKKHWIDSYSKQKEIPQYSILKHVNASDEWLVEAYVETDFSALTDQDFERTLLDYATFLFANRLVGEASGQSRNSRRFKLDFDEWKPTKLGNLFEVSGTTTTPKTDLENIGVGKHPYVSTQSANNGIRGWYELSTEPGGVLTIDSAVAGFCAYQPLSFSASDHVEKLVPKGFQMDVEVALFLVTVINAERYRYSYGRKMNQVRIRNTVIKLPYKNSAPDWSHIRSYMRGLSYSKHLNIEPVRT